MKEPRCEKCETPTRKKYLGKIHGKYLCKKCRKEVRLEHRETMIKEEGIGEDLKELDRKIKREYDSSEKGKLRQRNYYHRQNPDAKYYNELPPKIKGSIKSKRGGRRNLYLRTQERQALFRILVRERGLDPEEAGERIQNLMDFQKEIRVKMKEEGKSEEEIKVKQQELLEELWRS